MKRREQIEVDALLAEREAIPLLERDFPEIEFVDDWVITFLYTISGALVELLGPVFWAALIILFIQAELSSR